MLFRIPVIRECDAFFGAETLQNQTLDTPDAGVVRDFPLVPNRAALTLRALADAYMAAYAGRDRSRVYTTAFWVNELGNHRVAEISADDIADVLDRLAATPVTKYAGKDPATGKKVLREFGRRKPATINRLKSVVSGMLTFAQRRRLMPRGWQNPCREIVTERCAMRAPDFSVSTNGNGC
jgi:hypothetical protein